MQLLPRQRDALIYLRNNNPARTILYGGAAGGGKTRLGCIWQIQRRLKYPGTRSLIGRNKLDTLKKTTIASFFEVARDLNLQANVHFTYNQQSNTINFFNGSQIVLADLAYKPSDADYNDLGGLEITDAFIDEAAEVHVKAVSVISSRLRYKLNYFCGVCAGPGLDAGEIIETNDKGKPIKWRCNNCKDINSGLLPKLLLTSNPAKNYLYNEFYDPWRNNALPPNKAFIQALSSDNILLPEEYLSILNELPEVERKRLLLGDWDYDTSDDRLYLYTELLRAFRDKTDENKDYYITADIARLGKDRTVIALWAGLHLQRLDIYNGLRVNEVAEAITKLRLEYNVPLNRVLADEDGIGGGVCDLTRCRGFVNGSKAIRPHYANLKADAYYKLGELIDANAITFNSKYKDLITKELELVRRTNIGRDGKLTVSSKDDIAKKAGGLSPDVADAVAMRSYFLLSSNTGRYAIAGNAAKL